MLRVATGVAFVALGIGVALAQGTAVIKQRQDLMKASQEAVKGPQAMHKGQAPFDLAKVQASLKTLQNNANKLKTLWPEDSTTGGDTRALPKIWTNTKDFLDWFDGLAKDAKAAAESIKDEATFKTAWPNVVDYCGGCHKDFRAPKR
ncbi:MAG TPA: cytochrome c [Hyphomicrobiaceae bacterium]|nr:cytochrome c [Hyphomicrobiaceae bacterium]